MRIKFAYLIILTLIPTFTLAGAPPIHIPSEGWSLVFENDGIVVQERLVPGYPVKAYRAKGTLKAPIDQILGVLSDTNTATEWMPELDRQRVMSVISDVELITLNVYGVPFPFADRELLLHSQLRLDLPGNALVAEAVSIDEPKVSKASRRVRAHMVYSKTWLCPKGTDLTAIEFIIMVDPGGRIPDFLTAFGLRRMPFNFVRALEARAQAANYPLRSSYQALLRQLTATDAGVMGVENIQEQPASRQPKKHYAQSRDDLNRP